MSKQELTKETDKPRDCDHDGSTRETSDGARIRGSAAGMGVTPAALQKGPITRSRSAAMKMSISVEPLLTTSRINLRPPQVSKGKSLQTANRPDEQSAGPSGATAVDDQIVEHAGPQYVAQGQWGTPRRGRVQNLHPRRILVGDPAQIEIAEQTDFLQMEHQRFENLLEGKELIKEAVRRIHIKQNPSHLLSPSEKKGSDSDLSD